MSHLPTRVTSACSYLVTPRHNHHVLRPLAALTMLLTACSFSGDFGGTRYRCGEGGRCPDGQTCVAEYCVAESPVDGGADGNIIVDPDAATPDAATPDAAGPDAPPPAPVCGSLWLLTDTFDNTNPRPEFYAWTETGTTVTETGGQLVVTVAGGDGTGFGGYTSNYFYDLTEGGLEAKIGAVGGRNTVIEVRNLQDQAAQVSWENGKISARVFGVASPGIRREIAYDPAQVYWRIRVSAGVMYWETSANRTTWNLLHSEAAPFDVQHVRGSLLAGGAATAPSTARFDEVNTAAPTSPGHCAGSTLVDDFAVAPLPPIWFPYSDGACTVTETGGKLTMTFPGTGSVFCGIASRHLYDFTASSLVIDSANLPSRTNFVSYLQLVSPLTGETRVELTLDSGTLFTVNRINGTNGPQSNTTYNATNHRYWRLRGVGTQVELAVSPDATTWTPRLTVTPGFALTAVEVNVGAGHYANVTPSGGVTAQVPGVNAP